MTDRLAELVPALAHTLLHFLWQGALIGAGAALALFALRRSRPQARYAVACLSLLACLVVPIAHLVVQLAPVSASGTVLAVPTGGPRLFDFAGTASDPNALLWASRHWIVLLWALGASVMAARLALGLAWIRRLRPIVDVGLHATWQWHLDALARRFELRRWVELRIVEGIDTPASSGWWRPIVLLPASVISRMPVDLVEALLAHEIAHVRRHDFLVNLLQSIVETLLFYHPVVWWLSHRIRVEREEVADQIATERACSPGRLARALSELSELQYARAMPPLALAARGGQLMSRIARLVRPSHQAHPGARLALSLIGLSAICFASYAFAIAGVRDASTARSAPVAHVAPASTRDTFAFVHDQRISVWGPRDSADTEAAALGIDGDFLWAHHAGAAYVITDGGLVARARRAWAELDAVGHKIDTLTLEAEALRREVEVQGKADRFQRPLSEFARASDDVLQAWQAVGRQMDALHRRRSETAVATEDELKRVLGEAQARGLALPTSPRIASG